VNAKQTFQKLADSHPDDYRAAKAKLYIEFIDRKLNDKKFPQKGG
jgi:hypothetical protein